MKIRISATVEKETEKIIKDLLKKRGYRNKSHVIEEAIKKLDRDEK
jgi:Arc/MetJ-type ribon-helix-helix transcriptional regulator